MKALATLIVAFLLLLNTTKSFGITASDPIALSLQLNEDTFFIEGSFTATATPELVFKVLSDYDAIEQFVSHITSSQRVKGKDGALYLEQRGKLSFLLLPIRFYLLLKVTEIDNQSIHFADISHRDFILYEGSWQITSDGKSTAIKYSLMAKPRFSFWKSWIENKFKSSAHELLSNVQQEILKRKIASEQNMIKINH